MEESLISKMPKDEPIVTFRTYYDPMLAHIERLRLEDSGIHCFIQDEHISTINPFYNTAMGGIKLKVFERDIEACEGILGTGETVAVDKLPNEGDVEEAATICPNCGSTNTRYGYATERRYSWLGISFSAFFSFMAIGVMPILGRKACHCFNCGKDFKQGTGLTQ